MRDGKNTEKIHLDVSINVPTESARLLLVSGVLARQLRLASSALERVDLCKRSSGGDIDPALDPPPTLIGDRLPEDDAPPIPPLLPC